MSLLYEYMLIYSDKKQGLSQDAGVNYHPISVISHFSSSGSLGGPGVSRQARKTLWREKVINAIFFCKDTQYFIFTQKIKGFQLRTSDSLVWLFHFECKYISQHSVKDEPWKTIWKYEWNDYISFDAVQVVNLLA